MASVWSAYLDMRLTVAMRQDESVSQEVLTAGRGVPEHRHRRSTPLGLWIALGLIVASVLSVLAIATIVEWTSRTTQADRLLAGVIASEAVMEAAQTDLVDVLTQLEDENLTVEERQELVAELSVITGAGEIAIARAGESIEALTIWPWHNRLLQARDAYLAHNAAWVDYMAAASADPAELVRPQPIVNETFFAARDPLWRAIPLFDPLELRAEVVAIYADSDDNDAEGGGGAPA